MSDILRIGIAGLGTVGSAVLQLLSKEGNLLEKRCGKKIKVTALSARDKNKSRGVNCESIKWYDNAKDLAKDSNVDVVVELIGGDSGIAYELCQDAINYGKSVVTANKALISKHGNFLAKLSEEKKVSFNFEAAVAGGIPIIKLLKEGLAANKISKICGIMNGTCNYILTKMESSGLNFEQILKEAQDLGYAEQDPSFDVDGIDTAHKLSILAAIAFGMEVNFKAVHIEGIREIKLEDIAYAKELGYRIKLLGIGKIYDNGIEQAVYPAMIPINHLMANIDGVNNAVAIDSDCAGKIVISGAGAGGLATASAVVADIIDIASKRKTFVFNKQANSLNCEATRVIDSHEGEYYLRLHVKDRPGVLANITGILSNLSISMESILQRPSRLSGDVNIVGITHLTCETKIKSALKQLAEIDSIIDKPCMIRVEDFIS